MLGARAGLDLTDLRRQYDNINMAVAGIKRTGKPPPDDATLIAFFDHSLPLAYSQLRQFVRGRRLTSFVDHYEEYVSQTRAELSAQRPAAHAFAVTAPLHSYVGAHRLRNISLHSFTS